MARGRNVLNRDLDVDVDKSYVDNCFSHFRKCSYYTSGCCTKSGRLLLVSLAHHDNASSGVWFPGFSVDMNDEIVGGAAFELLKACPLLAAVSNCVLEAGPWSLEILKELVERLRLST